MHVHSLSRPVSSPPAVVQCWFLLPWGRQCPVLHIPAKRDVLSCGHRQRWRRALPQRHGASHWHVHHLLLSVPQRQLLPHPYLDNALPCRQVWCTHHHRAGNTGAGMSQPVPTWSLRCSRRADGSDCCVCPVSRGHVGLQGGSGHTGRSLHRLCRWSVRRHPGPAGGHVHRCVCCRHLQHLW